MSQLRSILLGMSAVLLAGSVAAAEDSIRTLVQQLGAADYEQREAAQAALSQSGAKAIDPLFDALESSQPEVVWRVAELLERISIETNNPVQVQQVVERLNNVPGPFRQELAQRAHRLSTQLQGLRSDRALARIQERGASVITSGNYGGLGNNGAWLDGRVMFGGVQPQIVINVEPEIALNPVIGNMEPDEWGPPADFQGGLVQDELEERILLPPNVELPAADLPNLGHIVGDQADFDPMLIEPPVEPNAIDEERAAEVEGARQVEAAIRRFVGWDDERVAREAEAQADVARPAPFEPLPPLFDPNLEFRLDELADEHPVPGGQQAEQVADVIPPAFDNIVLANGPAVIRLQNFNNGVIFLGDVNGFADSNLTTSFALQRTVVIGEQWTGTHEEFAMLTDVQGLICLQLNGLAIDSEMLATIAEIPFLQVLEMNRCEVDASLLLALKKERPQLSIQVPATARMGIFGSTGPRSETGCWVESVVENAPAQRAGIEPGDKIVQVDGLTIESFDDLAFVVSIKSPGEVVNVEVNRGGAKREFKIELERRSDE